MKYVTIEGATAIISVDGRFDLCNTVNVQSQLQTAYSYGCTQVMVDFKNTTYIDSSAIRDLTKTRRHVRPENFAARNAEGMVLAALKTANLDSWLIH